MKWKSRYEDPPKEGEKCIVVDRNYTELFFDTAMKDDKGVNRFYDIEDEFYMYVSEIISDDIFKVLKEKAKI